MVIMSKVAENLQELLDERGLTQTALAQEIKRAVPNCRPISRAAGLRILRRFYRSWNIFIASADFVLGLTEYPKEEAEYKPAPPFGEQTLR